MTKSVTICSKANCDKQLKALSLCKRHYNRQWQLNNKDKLKDYNRHYMRRYRQAFDDKFLNNDN